MAQVILGELVLRWCEKCGVPVLGRKCAECGSETKKVELTPPGDIRPGFEFDRQLITKTIDAQFGEGCGKALLPEGAVFILNKIPAIDRMDEVILGGEVFGAIRFDVEKLLWAFLPRISAAKIILPNATRGIVVADKGAVGPISQGANLLGPGVVSASDEISPGDEVLLIDPDRKILATGVSKMSTEQMRALSRGVGTKTRWFDDGKAKSAPALAAPATWEKVLEANKEIMQSKVRESVAFIKEVEQEIKKPLAVSFSGGKDSLAALLLALDAGFKPKMLYINTGLEFDETRQSVRDAAQRFGLEIIESDAGDKFWKAVEFFGPPGRDFRWCCKTCKLGPVTQMIKSGFPDGVLSLIGQRRYESEQRASKGKVWSNPWVPGQIGASPIQNWTALHVWLYLFAKQKEFGGGKLWNPLYEKGFDRIGCWLCPASDMAEFDLISKMENGPDFGRLKSLLQKHADKFGYSDDWIKFGVWRWRRMPPMIKEIVDKNQIKLRKEGAAQNDKKPLEFYSASGYQPCTGGVSIEGVFNAPLDLDRIANLLNAIGAPEYDVCTAIAGIGKNITIQKEGYVAVKGKDEAEVRRTLDEIKQIILRALNCVGCGVCIGRCKTGALEIKEGRVRIVPEKCAHCAECLGKCPAVDFGEREFEF
ncbi:MAG: phosphoadenosine phosphosulfate reductase family protein [Candidatus Thermoplasmatota archaeon]|nr:phosphoadenosine phosphosulfate reductase family protein [Candidatus Thermoplasmatota archaeon]